MYWCAKSPGRVIEKARNFSAFYALLPLILLFQVHSVQNISEYPPGNEVGRDGDTHVLSGAVARSALALPDYSFAPDDASAEVVVSSGAHVLTQDEESFLEKIASDKFWRRITKKKSRRVSPAQAKKRRTAEIESTRRSGLLTTKPAKGTFFGFFSSQEPLVLPPKPKLLARNVGIVAGGYRTLCVRLSDGYYWPISFATNRDQFLKDRRICKRSCAESVRLFVYRNPKGRPEDMVDLKGRRYSDIENAWRYREEYSPHRKCSPHPWEEASLAKHRAYALMAKRSVGQVVVGDARLNESRKLVRVGRVRTMSTIDLDYMGNAKYKIEGNPWKARISQAAEPKAEPRAAPEPKVVVKPQRVTRKVDRSRIMRLGVKADRAKSVRPAKRPRYRAKSRRRPKWVSEAFGFD